MKTPDSQVMSQMTRLFKEAAEAAGLKADQIERGQKSIAIVGTGVDVVWSENAVKRGTPGWQVRTTYHVSAYGDKHGHMRTDVEAVFGISDAFQVVLSAIMLVIQRRVEGRLTEII